MMHLVIEDVYDTTLYVSLMCEEDVISKCVCRGLVKDGTDVDVTCRDEVFHLHCIDAVFYKHYALDDGSYSADEYKLIRSDDNCTRCTKKDTCCINRGTYGYCKDYVKITCANCMNCRCNETRLDDRYCENWEE